MLISSAAHSRDSLLDLAQGQYGDVQQVRGVVAIQSQTRADGWRLRVSEGTFVSSR
jgi:hypothetical protein